MFAVWWIAAPAAAAPPAILAIQHAAAPTVAVPSTAEPSAAGTIVDAGSVDEEALAGIDVQSLTSEELAFRNAAIALQGGWVPPPGPLSPANAGKLLHLPRGSLSVGVTSHGRLRHARRIKARGKHYRFFEHIAERQTYWGTDEMQRFITRVANAVARRHKGAVLRLGNISLHRGGRSPWHHSHQAGRDVDICFYARDRQGKPVEMKDFHKFRRTGFSRDGELVFDDGRNLDVALAMLAQEETPVQWVFVARWLKRRMMKVAKARGIDEQTRQRLARLLHQPGDSAPHDDHFHVRLFCSLQDRKYGCLDRGPRRAWVDRFDDAFADHVARVAEAATLDDPKLRLHAVRLLARIEARSAWETFVARLADADSDVRDAALKGIIGLRLKDAAPGVLATCTASAVGPWARALFDAWAGLAPEGGQDIALDLIRAPKEHLPAALPKADRDAIIVRALRLLAEDGRPADVPALIDTLKAPSLDVRLAAHQALISLTNQSINARFLSSKKIKLRRRTIAAWRSFWRKSQAKGWLTWMKIGFRSHGVRLARGTQFVRRDIPRLIRALTSTKGPVARNAAKVLVRLTGHTPWLRRRSKRSLRRHWRYWWHKRGRRLALHG